MTENIDDSKSSSYLSGAAMSASAAKGLFQSVLRDYIDPEVERRIADGSLTPNTVIRKFQVLFEPNGASRVLLNDETAIEVILADPRGVVDELNPGQELTAEQLERIGAAIHVQLGDEANDNFGHISAFHFRKGEWVIGFDFRYNRPNAALPAATAPDFLDAARAAHDAGKWPPFIENIFCAYELAMKAIVWTHPEGFGFTTKMEHGKIHQAFFALGKRGVVPKPWVTAFSEIWELRNPTRYAYADAKNNWKAAERWLVHGDEIVRHARALGIGRRFTVDASKEDLSR